MPGPSVREQLNRLQAYQEQAYHELDLTGLATFALQHLQDLYIPTTFENIVVALYKLFPNRFSLEGYPEYPDAARVGRTLLQLAPKYRNWARGSVQKGFVLTERGTAKADQVRSALMSEHGAPQGESGPSTSRTALPRTMDLAKELAPIESSELFAKWKAGRIADGTQLDLLNMLGAYGYTPARALKDRVSFLENAASQLDRTDLVDFLKSVRRTFGDHFKDPRREN